MAIFSKFGWRLSTLVWSCAAALSSQTAGAQIRLPGTALTPTAAPTASYLVLLNPDRLLTPRTEQVRDDRFALFQREWGYLNPRVVGDVQRFERKYQFRVKHVFSSALTGFSVNLTDAQAQALSRENSVFSLEKDGIVSTTQLAVPALPNLGSLLSGLPLLGQPAPAPGPGPGPQPTPVDSPDTPVPGGQQNTPYGISNIGANNSWSVSGNGQGVVTGPTIYVIDTGIAVHTDLNVTSQINFADNTNTDCNGHGTHVSGTAAARDNQAHVVGVSPGTTLVAVKVLGCDGSGATSNVVKGIDWITANAVKPLAVANLSIGGSASNALDTAVKNSAASGILYAVAAGNNGGNACSFSPSRVGGAGNAGILVVAATDAQRQEASFSNSGSCVDIWAPGVGVLSTSRTGGTEVLSGTSMSAPHVAGAAALYIGLQLRNGQAAPSAQTIRNVLLGNATTPGTTGKNVLGQGTRAIREVNGRIN